MQFYFLCYEPAEIKFSKIEKKNSVVSEEQDIFPRLCRCN